MGVERKERVGVVNVVVGRLLLLLGILLLGILLRGLLLVIFLHEVLRLALRVVFLHEGNHVEDSGEADNGLCFVRRWSGQAA